MTTTPITSEPVIVNPSGLTEADTETLEARITKLEDQLSAQSLTNPPPDQNTERARTRHGPRPISRSRSPLYHRRYSPSPERSAILTNTSALMALLHKEESKTDGLVEVQSGPGRCNTHMMYITTLSTHQAELDKVAWILKMGVEDQWVKKPVSFVGRDQWSYDLPSNGGTRRRGRHYVDDDDFDDLRFDRGHTPVVKLGKLFTKIFPEKKDDEQVNENGVDGVQFITVLQGKSSGWCKLLVSHSRESALVDIFYELINGFSVLFVGAILTEVTIPLCGIGCSAAGVDFRFKQVGSVEEARKLELLRGTTGGIGVIC